MKTVPADEARLKAAECRELAGKGIEERQRVMLIHIAETWERIAKVSEEKH